MSAGLDGVDLPLGWRWSQLRHVTTVLHRGTAPEYVDEGPVHVVGQASNRNGVIDWSRTRFHAYGGDVRRLKGHLRERDVLVNSTGTGTLGRVAFYSGSADMRPSVADGHITIVRCRTDELDSRFLFYYLASQSFRDFMMSALVSGATNQIELS
ncbi:MAG: restriction endonuclease subunit S, partial [Actinomycetes bacterium]